MDSSTAKKEAKSKKTTPARLLELSRHLEPSVQLAVAKHANIPVAALEYLSGHSKFTILKAVAEHPGTPQAAHGLRGRCQKPKDAALHPRAAGSAPAQHGSQSADQ